MKEQIKKYTQKLIEDKAVVPASVRFFALDDELISSHADDWLPVFKEVFSELNIMGALIAKPSLPFADFLVARTPPGESRIYPKDSETKTFLHDIPFIRKGEAAEGLAAKIAAALRERKGLIVEGIGLVACGTVTLEQAYIVYSSIFHATFIKYLCDVLEQGLKLPGEREALLKFRDSWRATPTLAGLKFRRGPLRRRSDILEEIATVGRYTVKSGLVDSFFGNISLHDRGVIYISQTGASLDELDGLIDPVPVDNSSTVGITASSELAVHRKIYEATSYQTILHGHPKFSVVLSMLCDSRPSCPVLDCGKDCPKTRMLGDIPIVSGEIGAGGIARTVPPAVTEFGRALVFGHGPFCVGQADFEAAFSDLVYIEGLCRKTYFALLDKTLTSAF